MLGKDVGGFFEWTIRPELVKAMEELNIKGKHLLQKIYDEAIEKKHWVFFDWFPSYQISVQEYKEQAIANNWTDKVFQRLVKDPTKNGISNLQQGNFTWEEFGKIKNGWSEIQPVIKNIAEKNEISKAEYQEIANFFGKQTSNNRPAGTNRVIAAFLPNLVTTVVKYKYLRDVIVKLKNRLPDYPEIHEDWLIDNFSFIDYCNSNVDFIDSWHSSLFAWYLKEYFEKERQLIQKNEASIQKYIDIVSPDEKEQSEIEIELLKQKKSKAEILKELQNIKETDPETITIKGKTYKRDNKTIAQIKILRDFKCQICGLSILKRNGSKYVEAAHIIQHHKKGRATLDNIILLCPNHHKEFDLGDCKHIIHSKIYFEFSLNGTVYKLKL